MALKPIGVYFLNFFADSKIQNHAQFFSSSIFNLTENKLSIVVMFESKLLKKLVIFRIEI